MAAADRRAAFADHRVEMVWQIIDEFMRIGPREGALDLVLGRMRANDGQILSDGGAENKWVLWHNTKVATEIRPFDV